MKLADHTEHIRQLIDKAFRNRLGRMGLTDTQLLSAESIPAEYQADRRRMETIREVFIAETGTVADAYEKLVEELTFTLFNRLAALKVMEAHTLHPEIVTRRPQHGDRSFAHFAWLEANPDARSRDAEGLGDFLEEQLQQLSGEIPLFSPDYPYHLLPTAIELSGIIEAFNRVETDPQVEDDIWQSDDVLGWLYESYNTYKKDAHKASKAKTEYNKVSIQSQVYTPRWVVKFLVDNSLGKLYLEMYPDSTIKDQYKIANAPATRTREPKPLTEIRLIDPATGSGNFLLYAFDLFYDLYLDQINTYGADYDEYQLGRLIVEHNLHGVDLDDRAVQLAQLGLYIKAKRRRRSTRLEHFNIVSSDFFLPDYEQVRGIFEDNANLGQNEKNIIADLWEDLQSAHKFGALIRLEEKLNLRWFGTKGQVNQQQLTFFDQQNLDNFDKFKDHFFAQLQTAVAQRTARQGLTFLNTKTQDAITFLQLLTQKYDVAVANPPYTDSSDFGPELKKFIEENYKKPYKFHSNLYATFIKRCFELAEEDGKLALIHPLTFMYIKTFEDVRKFILEEVHINVFVDYGLSNLFGAVMVDPAFYVLEKKKTKEKAWFISLDQYTRTPNEKNKPDFCLEALDDYIANRLNKHNITLPQEKLKIIEGWPFIYWISDGFREKFKGNSLQKYFNIKNGVQTGNNDRYLRFWWELSGEDIDFENLDEDSSWPFYSKGGKFNKWYGNLWLVADWENLRENYSDPYKKGFFMHGVVFSGSSSKGTPFRYQPPNNLFDNDAPLIFSNDSNTDIFYCLCILNSQLITYVLGCLNPTVKTQVGDVKRVPFVKLEPKSEYVELLKKLSSSNVDIKRHFNSYSILENNFDRNPINSFGGSTLQEKLKVFISSENEAFTLMFTNEALINHIVFKIYELSANDERQVLEKTGESIGSLPVLDNARTAFLEQIHIETKEVILHIENLPTEDFEEPRIREIKEAFATLYQSNNDLEEFCIRQQLNPINVWYWFREAQVLPTGRAHDITLEFLADAIRTLLMQDEDGIIPLVGLPGEPRLLDRLEQHCQQQGFSSAQFAQLDGLLGRPLPEYLEQHFFRELSDHLNLFMYLPKTPFIWHLSSGEAQGFEAYVIIYKWTRDSLFRLKSQYIGKRIEKLEYRQIELQGVETAQAQAEKERIRTQLREIAAFVKKLDELIAEGYNPILDDGVGKNIAPLQKKGMLKAEVLNAGQLTKYLNADW